jgi:hypothetical protein
MFALLGIGNVVCVIAAFLTFSRWAISPLPLIIGILVATIAGVKLIGGITLFVFPGIGAILMVAAYFFFRKMGWA